MARTRLQLDADRHAATLRLRLAEDLRRLREDAGACAGRRRAPRRRRPVGALAGGGRLAQAHARDVRADRGGAGRGPRGPGVPPDRAPDPRPPPGADGRGRDRLAPPALAGHARGGRPEPGARLDRPRAPRPGRAAGGGGRARVRAAQARAADPLERPEGRRDRGGLAAAGRALDTPQPAWRSRRRGGCCARPTRPTRAMRSRRSPGPRPGPGPRSSGRGSTAAGPTSSPRTRRATAPSASANGSRFDEVKPATLIRPWPTT